MLIFDVVRDHSVYVLPPHSPVRSIHRMPTDRIRVIPAGTTSRQEGNGPPILFDEVVNRDDLCTIHDE
jgi:hypothetical protein